MKWNDLSDVAKNVIEWIENPFTRKRETIVIKAGECFTRGGHGTGDVNILVTQELFEEVRRFVASDSNIQSVINLEGELMFAIKAKSKLRLH